MLPVPGKVHNLVLPCCNLFFRLFLRIFCSDSLHWFLLIGFLCFDKPFHTLIIFLYFIFYIFYIPARECKKNTCERAWGTFLHHRSNLSRQRLFWRENTEPFLNLLRKQLGMTANELYKEVIGRLLWMQCRFSSKSHQFQDCQRHGIHSFKIFFSNNWLSSLDRFLKETQTLTKWLRLSSTIPFLPVMSACTRRPGGME